MSLETVFDGADFKSHMPFCDGKTLLFCRSDQTVRVGFEHGGSFRRHLRRNSPLREQLAGVAAPTEREYRNWKLSYACFTERLPQRLETGLPENAVECSPAFFKADDTWHVSFIGGIPGRYQFHYRLYSMSGPSLQSLSPAQIVSPQPTRAGFVSPLHTCLVYDRKLHLLDRQTQQSSMIVPPFAAILRVSFSADQPQHLIVTGVGDQNVISTLIYHLEDQQTWELDSAGDAYKPSLWGDQILFAERRADDFEDRVLRSGTFALRPSEHQFELISPSA